MRAHGPALAAPAATVLGLLVLSPAASALPTATVKVPRPDGGHVSVSWPGTANSAVRVSPGTGLRVRVAQVGRGGHAVTIVARAREVDGASTALRTKRLQRGLFVVKATGVAGRRLTLSLRSRGRLVRTSIFEIAPAAAPPAPTTPPPTPASPAPSITDPCAPLAQGTVAGALTAASLTPIELQVTAGPGEPPIARPAVLVRAELANTGTACFGRPSFAVDRLAGEAWETLPSVPGTGVTAEWFVVGPGRTTPAAAFMPADAPAGTYRLRASFTPAPSGWTVGSAGPTSEASTSFAWSGPPPSAPGSD